MSDIINQLFEGNSPIAAEPPINPVNIQYIAALESSDIIALVANSTLTGINMWLLLHKRDSTISFTKDLSGFPALKKLYFCLFMGFLRYKEEHYLVFCDKAKCHKFGRFDVFEIRSVVVYSLFNFAAQVDLSNMLTEYYRLGFMFSYDFDLTDSGNYLAAFNTAEDPFRHRMNFLYFANRNLVLTCITSKNKEWAVPIIYGHLHKERVKLDESSFSQVFFLYRASMLDINKRYKEDTVLLEDFYCPTSFNVIDTFIEDEFEVKSFGVIFNDFPGITRQMKSKTKSDYFSSHISACKVTKYFEFMRYFHHCPAFVFSGKKESVELMKGVKEYKEMDSTIKSMVKIFTALKTDEYKDLLRVSQHIIDKLNVVGLLGGEESEDIIMPYISFCTERPIDEMEECFFTIYQNYIKNETIRRRTLSKHRRRLSSDDIQLENVISNEYMIEYRKTIKTLFRMILYSKYKIDNYEELVKTNLKGMNVKTDLKTLLKHIYGPKNSISRGYRKILAKHNLPVYRLKEMNIGILTHNCSGATPNKQVLSELFYNEIKAIQKSDVLVVGLQEIVEMKSKNWGKIISNDNKSSLTPWIETLVRLFEDFEVLTHVSMLGLVAIVFINKNVSHMFDVGVSELELIKLGKLNFANKGGIFLKFKVNHEHIGIFNCHLAAGTKPKYLQRRKDNLLALADSIKAQQDLSMCFIIGDMNFRTQVNCTEAIGLVKEYIKTSSSEEHMPYLTKLLSKDELTEFLKTTKGTSLENFAEAPIGFLPSYKWGIGQLKYNFEDTNKSPSWLA